MNARETIDRVVRTRAKVILITVLGLVGSLALLSPPSHDSAAKSPKKLPLVQPGSLKYEGAFRVPKDTINGSSFDWGGTAIAFSKKNHSLFIVGHDHDQLVAEISIPKIIESNSLGSLETAEIIQPFADASDGRMDKVDDDGAVKIGGLYVRSNRLFGTAYSYYDADGSQVG